MRSRPPECAGCPLDPRSPGYVPAVSGGHVPPSGPVASPVLFVGISPGEEEEERGAPFVGPAGRKLRRAWSAVAGPSAPEPRFINLVNCRTVKPGRSKARINRDPTAREIRECAERFLLPELARTSARVIVLLGDLVYKSLLRVRLETRRETGLLGEFTLAMGFRVPFSRSVRALVAKNLGRKDA